MICGGSVMVILVGFYEDFRMKSFIQALCLLC